MKSNYFESEYYKIVIIENKYNDKFDINMNNIRRTDSKGGWGQNLKILFRNKILAKEAVITVGKSEENTKTYIIPEQLLIIPENKNLHYEDDNYKIFYISEQYNDIFKIKFDYDKQRIKVSRVDIAAKEGWGQDLHLKFIDKKAGTEKIIHIGKSDKNKIYKQINIVGTPIQEHQIQESEKYKITVINDDNVKDTFDITFFEESMTIRIRRLDKREGWGQHLKLNVYDKIHSAVFVIYVGSSKINEIYKKVDLAIRRCNVALTTIPSRIKLPIFIENIKHFIKNQTYEIDNFFITVAKKYRRFSETVCPNIIEEIRKISKVIIIEIDEDYGPGSKYLGPLLNYQSHLLNSILIIIDDDRKYNKNLVRNFVIGYNSFPNITFSSGYFQAYFQKNYSNMSEEALDYYVMREEKNRTLVPGQGVGGFFGFGIKIDEGESIQKFIDYNMIILSKVQNAFLHDEGIILGYLKGREENILYIKHKGCNFIDNEMVDALCKSNLCDRVVVEKDILNITYLENLI